MQRRDGEMREKKGRDRNMKTRENLTTIKTANPCFTRCSAHLPPTTLSELKYLSWGTYLGFKEGQLFLAPLGC